MDKDTLITVDGIGDTYAERLIERYEDYTDIVNDSVENVCNKTGMNEGTAENLFEALPEFMDSGIFSSAIRNIGTSVRFSEYIQKETENDEGEMAQENAYYANIVGHEITVTDEDDDGRAEKEYVTIGLELNGLGEVLADDELTVDEKISQLEDSDYICEDGWTEKVVEDLIDELEEVPVTVQLNDDDFVSSDNLTDGYAHIEVEVINDMSLSALMGALKIGSHSIDINLVETLDDAGDPAYSVSWSPDGDYLASGSGDENVYVYETTDFKLEETLKDAGSFVHSVSWSPDGDYLASGSVDNNVYVYETTDFTEETLTLTDAEDFINSVSWSPDGNYLASGSSDENVYVYETTDFKLEDRTLDDAEDFVHSVSWSPDGNYLASGSYDENVYVYKTTDFTLEETLKDAGSYVYPVSWSPDGNYLASGSSDENVYVYETTDFKLEETLKDAKDRVNSVSWSPDGNYLASGSYDENVYVYKTTDFKLEETLTDAEDFVHSVSWSPDGNYLASGSNDDNVYVYEMIALVLETLEPIVPHYHRRGVTLRGRVTTVSITADIWFALEKDETITETEKKTIDTDVRDIISIKEVEVEPESQYEVAMLGEAVLGEEV